MTKTVLAASLAALALAAGDALAASPADATTETLLTAQFAPRSVAKIEGGDFHFAPGQRAPVHTHLAPAVGVVVKGTILYQIEGEPVRTLRAGDAFYEPAGPEIVRFDNASATEEAVFIDTNWQRAGDPFIHFDAPPTEKIDRRTLTTALAGGASAGAVAVERTRLAAGGASQSAARPSLRYGYVMDGAVEVRIAGTPAQRFEAGQTFVEPAGAYDVRVAAADAKDAVYVTFAARAE